jgi:drug/metabolite transporter (DMT)-like permease
VTFLLAVIAALVFGAGVAFQQRAAVTVPKEYAGKPGLLLRLVRNPFWLLGLLGDVGGFALQTAALRRGSLVVVQPIMTTSIVFTLWLTAAWSRQAITRTQWGAIALVLIGLSLFLIVASPPDQAKAVADTTGWVLCGLWVASIAVVAIVVGLRHQGAARAAYLGVAAGMSDAFMAVLVKAFASSFNRGLPGIFLTWTPYAVVVTGITALLLIQTAYQAGHPTISLPIITVIDPLVASLIGVTLFGERVLLGGVRAPMIAVAAIIMLAGLLVLSRNERVTTPTSPAVGRT